MGRTLLRVAAWVAATALAVTMSWFGVHQVLSADVSGDAPLVIPVGPRPSAASRSPMVPPALSVPVSTVAPVPSRTAGIRPAGTTTGVASSAPAPGRGTAAPPTRPTSTVGTPDIRGYQLTGGRVVLETTPASARLVSATPESGWQVQAWQGAGWLRVDFSRSGTTSSCFVTWNGHPPTVQTT